MGRGQGQGAIPGAARAPARAEPEPVVLRLWHGSTRRRLGRVRPGFFATSALSEAEDYAGVGVLDPEDQGEVAAVTITLRRPKRYEGQYPGVASPEVRALPGLGHDGLVVTFAADVRDPSAPMPERTWAYAFSPESVSLGH